MKKLAPFLDLRDLAALGGLGLMGAGLYHIVPLPWMATALGALVVAAALGWTRRS